jgi:hypothetical protein
MPIPDSVRCFVVGECVDRALVARSQRSLALAGIQADAYEFKFGVDRRPLHYGEVVGRLLRMAGPRRHVVLIPAGVIALAGFGDALCEFVDGALNAARPAGWQSRPLSGAPREVMLSRGIAAGESRFFARTVDASVTARTDFVAAGPARGNPRPWGSYDGQGRVFPVTRGEQTFQALQARAGDPAALEMPITVLDKAAFDSMPPGWAFLCNNEPVRISLAQARHCDCVVAVGSGIKPWYLANELRHGISRLIIADANPVQLRFAWDVLGAIRDAKSWDDLWRLPGYMSEDDDQFRAGHNLAFQRIRQGIGEWNFDVDFLHCDIIKQSFGLLNHIRSLGLKRPLFWYSNIFQPYLGKTWSEHHEGVEFSFVSMLRQTFPETVVFNSGEHPIGDPRRSHLFQSPTRALADSLGDWLTGRLGMPLRPSR